LLGRTKTANLEQAFFQLTGTTELFENDERLGHFDDFRHKEQTQ